jgi:hypothetical protein
MPVTLGGGITMLYGFFEEEGSALNFFSSSHFE